MPTSRIVQRQCPLCEAHCGIRVELEGDRVLRIEGDPDDVLSEGSSTDSRWWSARA